MKMLVPVLNGVTLEDTLNKVLMNVLFGDLIVGENEAEAVLLGSGTLLAFDSLKKIKPDAPRIVFSSGYWKGTPEPLPVDSKFVAVRGKATCQFFGLNEKLARGDAACLITATDLLGDDYRPVEDAVREEAVVYGMEQMGQMPSADVFYDYTNGDALNFVNRLLMYRKISTASFVTAVIADAYRIPWRPLVWDLRWHDYFGTLFGMEYDNRKLFDLTDENRLAEVQSMLLEDVETIKEM